MIVNNKLASTFIEKEIHEQKLDPKLTVRESRQPSGRIGENENWGGRLTRGGAQATATCEKSVKVKKLGGPLYFPPCEKSVKVKKVGGTLMAHTLFLETITWETKSALTSQLKINFGPLDPRFLYIVCPYWNHLGNICCQLSAPLLSVFFSGAIIKP